MPKKHVCKKWYHSKTVWALIGVEAAAVASALNGYTHPAVLVLVSALNALAVYGRAVASGPLSK